MASGNDIKTAQATYNGFIKASVWGAGITIVVVAIVVALITS
ncbi:aa3-type cytochrome c oxidase subunit IV [Novosphingobium malaysiense]|nr:aa3-type cytochrome c oxidase subunit IV [Novosphingobium malaysiense]